MSTLRLTNLGPLSGTTQDAMQGLAKAWANLNGTGTVAFRDSFNVSSLTDNGTGIYTFDWTNAMANADYATLLGMDTTASWGVINTGTPFAGSCVIVVANDAGSSISAVDNERNSISIHGDLA